MLLVSLRFDPEYRDAAVQHVNCSDYLGEITELDVYYQYRSYLRKSHIVEYESAMLLVSLRFDPEYRDAAVQHVNCSDYLGEITELNGYYQYRSYLR